MNLNWHGAELNLSALKGEQLVFNLRVTDDDERDLDMSNVTFAGVVTGSGGEVKKIGCSALAGSVSEIVIVVPALDEGEYEWELSASNMGGEVARVVHGKLGVVDTSLTLSREGDSVTRLQARVLGSGRVLLNWQASSLLQKRANDAELCAKRAEAAVESLVDAEGRLKQLEEFTEKLKGDVSAVIRPNLETNTWWIGGVDSGVKVAGANGKSPYIGNAGNWVVWDDVGQQWKQTVYSAVGKDGVDGDAVRRFFITSTSQLPAEGQRGVYYYIRVPGRYAEGSITFNSSPAADIGLFINNVRIVTSVAGASPEVWAEAINNANVGVRATAHLYTVTVRANEAGVEGNSIRLGLGETLIGLPIPAGLVTFSGDHLTGGESEHLDVYAWVEHADGSGEWVAVMENQLGVATKDSFGLVKLGVDTVFGNYVCVGLNENGGLAIPRADRVTCGAVYVGGGDEVTSDAVGFKADGALGIREASVLKDGVVRLASSLSDADGVVRASQVVDYTLSKEEAATKQELLNLANKTEISEAVEGMATKDWVLGQNYITRETLGDVSGGEFVLSSKIKRLELLTRQEFLDLAVKDSTTCYIQIAESDEN